MTNIQERCKQQKQDMSNTQQNNASASNIKYKNGIVPPWCLQCQLTVSRLFLSGKALEGFNAPQTDGLSQSLLQLKECAGTS